MIQDWINGCLLERKHHQSQPKLNSWEVKPLKTGAAKEMLRSITINCKYNSLWLVNCYQHLSNKTISSKNHWTWLPLPSRLRKSLVVDLHCLKKSQTWMQLWNSDNFWEKHQRPQHTCGRAGEQRCSGYVVCWTSARLCVYPTAGLSTRETWQLLLSHRPLWINPPRLVDMGSLW